MKTIKDAPIGKAFAGLSQGSEKEMQIKFVEEG